jgi:hypothetical protein
MRQNTPIKQFFTSKGISVTVSGGSNGKGYVSVKLLRNPLAGPHAKLAECYPIHLPLNIRQCMLKAIYGENKPELWERGNAGNVNEFSLAFKFYQWEKFLAFYAETEVK